MSRIHPTREETRPERRQTVSAGRSALRGRDHHIPVAISLLAEKEDQLRDIQNLISLSRSQTDSIKREFQIPKSVRIAFLSLAVTLLGTMISVVALLLQID